jgi:hypothetical protein
VSRTGIHPRLARLERSGGAATGRCPQCLPPSTVCRRDPDFYNHADRNRGAVHTAAAAVPWRPPPVRTADGLRTLRSFAWCVIPTSPATPTAWH